MFPSQLGWLQKQTNLGATVLSPSPATWLSSPAMPSDFREHFLSVQRNFLIVRRVGGDAADSGRSRCVRLISILTPAWGGDLPPYLIIYMTTISILTPAWGVTAKVHRIFDFKPYSFAHFLFLCRIRFYKVYLGSFTFKPIT